MEYITTAERIGMKKGRKEGRKEGVTAGMLIGQILLMQRLLREPRYSKKVLENKPVSELETIFAELESRMKWS